ncbi:MAG: hypothetical protein A2297_03510 [Elusimicrobia bacterium RIFOXYB2_FULL_48_7]|nr:MAG: hypothetical protein A2297_03510 [Elusimicrobia bacterium RIFOXYB2_FULL_48_7]
MKKNILCSFLLFSLAALFAPDAGCKSIFQKQFGIHEIEVEVDPYYTSFDYYLPLSKKPIECLVEDDEFRIYKDLLANPKPTFLVLEASLNPLPCMGAYIKENYRRFYDDMRVSESLNLVNSVCAGFEEPYAFAFLLGNVVSFKPQGADDCEGKGYFGLLGSVGNFHIKDNEIINDIWYETELKIKGSKKTKPQNMSWSFRIGSKFHDNTYIKDIFYFSIYRERVDFNFYAFSFIKNSSLEYTIDVDKDSGIPMRHLLLFGKKFPMKTRRIAATLKIGVLWEGYDKYTGPLTRNVPGNTMEILIRPNIEF